MDSLEIIKVLLIEDNPGDARLIQEMLRPSSSSRQGVPDFKFVHCGELAKALAYLQKHAADIILLDLHLPDSQGLETFTQMQAQASQTPIIILTGMSDDTVGATAVHTGAQDYFIKGQMDGHFLRRAIGYAIERQRLRLELQQKADDLSTSEARLRILIEHNADGILVIDKAGTIRFSNPAAQAIFGYSKSELLGQDFGYPILDKNIAELEVINQKSQRNLTIEMRLVETEWSGEPSYMATLRDITERRRAEMALKESESRFRSLVENLPDVIFRYDSQQRHIYVSPNVVDMLGHEPDDYLGKTHRELGFLQEEYQFWETRLQTVFETSQLIEEEFSYQGTARQQYLNWRLVPEFGSEGKIKSVLAITRDITERVEAEEAMIAERNLLRTVIDNLPDLVYVKNLEGQYVTVNVAAMQHIHANSLIDVVGKTDFDLYPEEFSRRTQQIETHTLSTGSTVINKEILFLDDQRNNSKQWLLCTTVPLRDRDGQITGLVGIRRDITDRRRAEEALKEEHALLAQRIDDRTRELRETNRHLTHALRVKDEFLANMSHELRTPLNAILGMSEVLQEKIYGDLNEQQLRSASIIEESGRHLLDLINDILDVARIEADKLHLDKSPVLVEDICETCIRFVHQAAKKKKLKLSVTYSELGMVLEADERRLKQILVNLLNNAVKFTPAGGKIGLKVEGSDEQGRIDFVVWDTGIGIAQENLEKLFQPFVQLDSRLAREHEGTGLGLALVRLLAEMHNAAVSVDSEPGTGSSFTVSMPWDGRLAQIQTEDDSKRDETVFAEIPQVNHHNNQPLILLAEDNVANVEVMTNYLLAKGYRVEVAYDGLQAVEQTKKLHPDLILMDIQMPEVDGLEATKRIRDDKTVPAVPIIALTALAMPGDKERCLAAGANEYLSKPVSLRGLTEAIEIQLRE